VPDREIRINHVYDAPREAVFEAWTVEPDGKEWPLRSEILEISPPELIVMRSEPMPESGREPRGSPERVTARRPHL
jgi:uncharacterized protein YndB with AHSA1/START domain